VKLSPEKRREILREMRLAEIFNTKRWSQRYCMSHRTVKRLRAEAREQLARGGPATAVVVWFTTNGPQRVREA